jgi:ATP/maltotriose-dependent transcriptional regulator MalT
VIEDEGSLLPLIAGAATNRQVAARLAVGDETVKTLLARTFAKLGVSRRAEAVSRGHELGLL